MDIQTPNEWANFYKKIVYWQLELQTSGDNTFSEILENQFKEANVLFGKFIEKELSTLDRRA